MGVIPFGLRQTGSITGVLPNNFLDPNIALTSASVTVNFQINTANGFLGGNLRDMNGNQYGIISHNTAAPPNSSLRVEVLPGLPAPAVGPVEITQGDFQVGSATGLVCPACGQYIITVTPISKLPP